MYACIAAKHFHKKAKIMQHFPDIHFDEEHPLSYYETISWNVNETRLVEFFPGILTPVYLVSVNDPNLLSYLSLLEGDDSAFALDLEWEDELCLLQFCSSKCTLIVRHPNGPGDETLKQFLSSHKFYAVSYTHLTLPTRMAV